MDLATLFVRFKPDTSAVDKGINDMESKATKSGQNIASTLAKAFSAAVIVAGIKRTIDAASDLNETVSKTEVIFGNASTAVEKNADTAAKSMGLSKRAYLDAAASLKGLLDNMGLAQDQSVKWSQKLVQLGSDLGSFFNKDPEQAIEAIGAAIRGETEPIRAFNVQISQAAVVQEALRLGLIKTAGELDNNAKAQATLSLIMAQTTTAQGDFARTADGAANSQRVTRAEMENTAASIGQSFLPIYTKIVQLIGDVADAFGSLPAPVQTGLIALGGFVLLSGPISTVVSLMGSLSTVVKSAGSAVAGAFASNPGLIALAGLAALVTGVVVAVQAFAAESHEAEQRAKAFYDQVERGVDQLDLVKVSLADAADAARDYSDAAYAEADKQLRDTIAGNQRYVTVLQQLGLSLDDVVAVNRGGVEAERTLAEARQRGLEVARQLIGSNQLQSTSAEDVAKVYAGLGRTYDGAADSASGQVQAIDQLITLLLRQAGASYDSAQAAAELAKVGDDQAYTYLKVTGQLGLLTAAEQRAAEAHLDASAAAKDETAATDDLATAITTVNVAAEEYKVRQDQLAARQKANADATGQLRDAIEDTGSEMYDAERAASDLDDALRKLLGIGMDVEEANRALAEGIDKVAESVKENGKTLDINTEKGRANRSAIQDQVEAIEAKIKADVQSGVSTKDATNAGLLYREQLLDTAEQLGLNRADAEAYINQLGLTPENVQTAVELQHDEEVKARLQGMLDQLGAIDAGAAAEIQALIDRGAFDQAEAELTRLARQRIVPFKVSGNFTSGDVAGSRDGRGTSTGGFFAGGYNGWRTIAEIPGRRGDEAVLPLGDPARMRAIMSRNDVGSRIFDAVGDGRPATAAATMPATSSAGSVSAGGSGWRDLVLQNFRQDLTVDDVVQVMNRAELAG